MQLKTNWNLLIHWIFWTTAYEPRFEPRFELPIHPIRLDSGECKIWKKTNQGVHPKESAPTIQSAATGRHRAPQPATGWQIFWPQRHHFLWNAWFPPQKSFSAWNGSPSELVTSSHHISARDREIYPIRHLPDPKSRFCFISMNFQSELGGRGGRGGSLQIWRKKRRGFIPKTPRPHKKSPRCATVEWTQDLVARSPTLKSCSIITPIINFGTILGARYGRIYCTIYGTTNLAIHRYGGGLRPPPQQWGGRLAPSAPAPLMWNP